MGQTVRLALALAVATTFAAGAQAQDVFKIGSSVGLLGYIAQLDQGWRDGVALAVEAVNAQDGIGGRKVVHIVEDNHSIPQDALIGYKKMIQQDQVNYFASGCLSAGTFAAAPAIVEAQIPLAMCSIMPQRPEQRKWAFQIRAPTFFDLETRVRYLVEVAKVKKVGLLHDQAPFTKIEVALITKTAPEHGLDIVGDETYNNEDADLSNQIGRLNAAGAGAILKIGTGGTSITAAKNIKELGLNNLLLLVGDDDLSSYKGGADTLGDRLLFSAEPSQMYEPNVGGAQQQALGQFMERWTAKFGERSASFGASGWDAVMIGKRAAEIAHSVAGPALRDAIEQISDFQGAAGVYGFTAEKHEGIEKNPYVVAKFKNGKVVAAD